MAARDVKKLLSVLTEINLSIESAASGSHSGGSTPDGCGSEGAAGSGAAASAAPSVEQTGEISGTAYRSPLPSLPVPRVA